jgi:glyoxylase-like metal-dependent hydrolase (beta-lactamase superfamily II)
MAFMASPFPAAARTLFAHRTAGAIVAQEPFGRLESVGEGLWALVSTPLGGDYTTVCNGGIIAGSSGVLVVEAFQTPGGARWMAEKARELTGRWPTHVLVTHYHGDHTSGAEGFAEESSTEAPPIHVTPGTLSRKQAGIPADAPQATKRPWADVVLLPEDHPQGLNLGNRPLQVVPRRGHTASDVSVHLEEEGVVWCGDLVWNGMFPNYMDAVPSQLSRSVRSIQASGADIFVPGHGPVATPNDMTTYRAVIDGLEETARQARREGWTSEEAAARHVIPEGLGEWTLFNPSYFQRAVEAWMKEWG